jgi:hypothetical protein
MSHELRKAGTSAANMIIAERRDKVLREAKFFSFGAALSPAAVGIFELSTSRQPARPSRSDSSRRP